MELTTQQKRYLTEALKELCPWFNYFNHDRVAAKLKLSASEARDTRDILMQWELVDTNNIPAALVRLLDANDEAGYDIERAKRIYFRDVEYNPVTLKAETTYGLSQNGREQARHIREEKKTLKRGKIIDGLKTYVWPIAVAVIVTWLNNYINGTKTPASKIGSPQVPVTATPEIRQTPQAPVVPTTPEKPQRGVNEMPATVPAVPIISPTTQR